MPDQPKGPYQLLKCPLCEGRGELPHKDLLDRLDEKDLGHKLASYVENFIVADEKASGRGDGRGRRGGFQASRGYVELHPLLMAAQSERVTLV